MFLAHNLPPWPWCCKIYNCRWYIWDEPIIKWFITLLGFFI